MVILRHTSCSWLFLPPNMLENCTEGYRFWLGFCGFPPAEGIGGPRFFYPWSETRRKNEPNREIPFEAFQLFPRYDTKLQRSMNQSQRNKKKKSELRSPCEASSIEGGRETKCNALSPLTASSPCCIGATFNSTPPTLTLNDQTGWM